MEKVYESRDYLKTKLFAQYNYPYTIMYKENVSFIKTHPTTLMLFKHNKLVMCYVDFVQCQQYFELVKSDVTENDVVGPNAKIIIHCNFDAYIKLTVLKVSNILVDGNVNYHYDGYDIVVSNTGFKSTRKIIHIDLYLTVMLAYREMLFKSKFGIYIDNCAFSDITLSLDAR